MVKKTVKIVFGLLIGLIAVPVLAAGLSITPSRLDFNLPVKTSAKKIVVIKNIAQQPSLFKLYFDELGDQLLVEPSSFRLDPWQSQEVVVTVKPKKQGLFLTNLSVVAQNLNRQEFNVDTGAKVPVQFNVLPGKPWLTRQQLAFISLICTLALLILLVWLLNRPKQSWWQHFGKSVNLLGRHRKKWWQ